MVRILAAALAILLVCSTAAPAALPANEPPLADAGLDQTVPKHTTVHLDATGSRDPDGSIEAYDWTIRTPTGATTTPDCATCARTQFEPATVGTYRVTLTVTDDDGATTTDTLYVTVTPGAPPDLSVTGPSTTRAGTPATYTASATAGGAPLDTVTWSVDGTTVSSTAVSGNHSSVDLHHTFGSPGSHTVSATVTDVDGRTDTDSITVTVDPDRTPPNGTSPRDTYAERDSPVVDGPDLLTGSRPLDATYTLDSDVGHVRSVHWWRDSRSVATGTTYPVTWLPGRHDLYAVITYIDGSQTVARFPDGSTLVEADPKPNATLVDVDERGRIAGVATATDDFDNLRQLTVTVDGEQVASKSIAPAELRSGDAGSALRLPFEYSNVTPEEPHRVTVRARDARGQESTYTTTITPEGAPEIVSSGFVNGPVDSYHPKLDPERYAAHHVLKVDLNGVDPEEVSIDYSSERDEKLKSLERDLEHERRYKNDSDLLIIQSYWAGNSPGAYDVVSEVAVQGYEQNLRSLDMFSVTPSKPEIRVDIVSDGTPHDKNNWGVVVDASESFDPDGTDLKYIWGGGAEAISKDNATAKFNSMQVGTLKVRDGDGQTSVFHSDLFLYYYTPEIESVTEVSDGPYKPNDSVVFDIRTESFRMPKNNYYEDFGVKLASAANSQVLRWKKEVITNTTDISDREQQYYTGTVEIPASALKNSSQSALSIYNTGAPDKSRTRVTLPRVQVLEEDSREIGNVTVVNTSYLTEQPTFDYVRTPYRSRVKDYRSRGYSLVGSSPTGTRYTLEKRVKVQDAEYRTDTRRFDSRGRRNVFMDRNPGWERGSTETETRRWTTTEDEWRDTQSGTGTFTGETRRILTEPAEYRTKRQYKYEYQVQRTGTRTVTRTKTYRVPVTRYRWVTECTPYGCYRGREAYTVWETRTRRYQTTETYQYTVTETDTYWSFRKRSPSDDYTGRSKRVKVEPAEYETQYQYEYQVEHHETTRYYTATRDVLVQPAEYEWREYKTTKSETVAETTSAYPDRRIGSEEPAKRWMLRTQTGTQQRWTNEASANDVVRKTRATVTYTVYQERVNDGSTEVQEREGTEQMMLEGYRTPNEITIRFQEQLDEYNRDDIA